MSHLYKFIFAEEIYIKYKTEKTVVNGGLVNATIINK